MKYHRGKRFGLTENTQSLIYWQCVNFKCLSAKKQQYVYNLCDEIAGEYRDILFAAVTTTTPVTTISYRTLSTNLPIYDSHLSVMVRKFYAKYADDNAMSHSESDCLLGAV